MAAAILCAGAGYYVLRTVKAPEWIRAHVVPTLEATYGRRVVFEDFSLRPRSIALTGVRILEAPEFAVDDTPFLYVERLVIGFDPFALLRRAFLVEYLRLVRPELRLHENEHGVWNIATLFDPERRPPTGPPEPAGERPFRLVVTRLEIKDGAVTFFRAPKAPTDPSTVAAAKDLDASVLFHPSTGFLDYQASVSITLADHQPAALKLFGALDLSGPRVRFDISADGLDADALIAFLSRGPRSENGAQFLDTLHSDVDHDLLFVATNLKAGGVDFERVRVDFTANHRSVELRHAEIGVLGGQVTGSGQADFSADPPTVALTLHAAALDVEEALALLPPGQIAGASARGSLTADVSIAASGRNSDELWESALGRSPGAKGATGIGASVELALEEIDRSVSREAADDTDTAPRAPPVIDLGTAVVDVKASVETWKEGAVTVTDSKIDAKVDAGTIQLREAVGNVFGGAVRLSGRADLRGDIPVWSGHARLSDVAIQHWIPESPHWDWARTNGRVDADLEIEGRGTSAEEFFAALRGSETERPAARIDGRLAVAVDALDLDLIGKPPRVRDEYGPIHLGNVRLDLGVESSRVRLWKLDYANVTAKGAFHHDTIDVESIKGSIADGALELSGLVRLDRKGLAYSGQGAFSDVETSLFSTTYLPKDLGDISGKGSASFEFELSGTKGSSALDSLTLDGYVALHSGNIRESRLLDKIAKTTGIKEFGKPELTRCGGDIHLANRRASTNRLIFGGTDARAFLIGSLGFDATLDLEVWLGFSPETERTMFSRGILLPYVTDDKGWTYVPFTARGTLKEPEITTTPEAVRSTALRAIPDATERIVRESSKLLPGGETIVGGSIDAVKSILGGLGRVLQINSARARGELAGEERRVGKPSPPHAPANHRNSESSRAPSPDEHGEPSPPHEPPAAPTAPR